MQNKLNIKQAINKNEVWF